MISGKQLHQTFALEVMVFLANCSLSLCCYKAYLSGTYWNEFDILFDRCLCTTYISFSNQLEAHQVNWNY